MNKGRSWRHGYTIVEALIFLAITGALAVIAIVTLGGQQRKTEFNNAVRDFESSLQDIANDVSSGYYFSTNTFSCSATPSSGPSITVGNSEQGANQGCIFLGRAIQFAPDGTNQEDYYVYTVAGKRQKSSGVDTQEVESLAEANPTTVPFGDAREIKKLGGGATFGTVRYLNDGVATQTGAIAFFSTLGKYTGAKLESSSSRVDLFVVPSSDLNQSDVVAIGLIDDIENNAGASHKNPNGGVAICINSQGTNQHADITLGGNGRKLTVYSEISGGACS